MSETALVVIWVNALAAGLLTIFHERCPWALPAARGLCVTIVSTASAAAKGWL